ncbi:unnamed protein product [Camellia sinensis]
MVIRMYTKQLLLGVEYLYRNGIMHRDIKALLIYGVLDVRLLRWLRKASLEPAVSGVAALLHIGTTKSHPPIPEHLSAEATDFLLKCLQKEPNLRPATSDLLQHPFVTREYQETYPVLRVSVMENFGKKMATPEMELKNWTTYTQLKDGYNSVRCSTIYHEKFLGNVPHWGSGNCDDDMCRIDDEDDLVIGASAKFDFALLFDDFNKPDDNWPCNSDDTLEKFPGNVPHWGSGNCDDDMCQIDDEDDFLIGASAKFDSALLSDDFNKSFNPISEPDNNWPCKFDDTLELECRVNLLSSQTLRMMMMIMKLLSQKLEQSLMRRAVHGGLLQGLEVDYLGSGNCDDDMCQIDDEDNLVIGVSTKFDSALLYDDFNKSFNRMSEPDDNWPCKSDDTPELESRVNLFSGQTVNKFADIPRASDDDDDEVVVAKYGLGRGGWCSGRVGLTHGRGVWKGIWLAVNIAYNASYGTYSQCVSNIGTESVQTLSQVQPPKPSEWKEVVCDDQELINPSASFYERKRIWEEELERKRVSSKEEVDAPDSFCIQPVDLNHFLKDGKIYGNQGLKITIWVSSISFHAYAEITFQSTSDGGKGDYRSEICSPVSIASKGEILQQNNTNAHNSDSNSYFCRQIVLIWSGDKRNVGRHGRTWVEVIRNDMTIVNLTNNVIVNGANGKKLIHVAGPTVIRVVVGTMPVGHLYSRLVPLVLILVDGSNPIDIIDPRCEILLIVQKKIDLQGDNQLRLLGFAVIYRFYHYPDSLHLWLSQS